MQEETNNFPEQIPEEHKIYLFGENKSAAKYMCKEEKNMLAFQASEKLIHIPVRQKRNGDRV